jgi:hypothetical protein
LALHILSSCANEQRYGDLYGFPLKQTVPGAICALRTR